MRTRTEINRDLSAVLTALREADTDAAETMFYLAMDSDIDRWTQVREILKLGGLVEVKANRVSLTEKGKTVADKALAFQGYANYLKTAGPDPMPEAEWNASLKLGKVRSK